MASNTQVTVCLQDEEHLEKLVLGWSWARHPVALLRQGGVFVSGGLAQPCSQGCAKCKAQLRLSFPSCTAF